MTDRGGGGRFMTTRWSVVLTAGRTSQPAAREAMATLCGLYWQPLYAFIRRSGASPEEAEDMTQAFLAHLMQKQALARADPARGRFRSFLLASMNHFMADAWDKTRALKRGGGKVIPLDFQGAETWLRSLASPDTTPEEAFEKRWALSLLEAVYRELEQAYATRGKARLFEILKPTLAGPREAAPYAELAASLETTEGAVRVAVYRLRRDYRETLRRALRDLVERPEDVDDELRYLQRVLSG